LLPFVKVGRKVERRIRPSELARLLAKAQKRPQRFREQRFLELLYRTWRRLTGADRRDTAAGPVVALADIYEWLTPLPGAGADYPSEEFARDLLLLDRRPDLRTQDGYRFELPASTLSKGRMKRLVVYDEQRKERTYIGLRFLKEERIRRGVFTSVPELEAAIHDYLEHHNADPKPFVWTKSAQEILAKVTRARNALQHLASGKQAVALTELGGDARGSET
jgi:hypothetical protein